MKTLRAYLRVIRMAAELAVRRTATDLFVLFSILVQPLLIALLALLMLQGKSENYGIFVVVGGGLAGLWSTLLFVSGNTISHERWTGTLEGLVGVPTPIWVVVLGKVLAHVLQSLSSMVLAYALASLILGYPLVVGQPLWFALSCLAIVVSFVSFGMMLSTLFVLNAEVQRFNNALEYPIYMLSGFLFPVLLLPDWTTPLSYMLAPYWAARALHSTAAGEATLASMSVDWGLMLLLGAVYAAIAAWLFRVILEKARREATLGFQ